ncbi:sepiapterin reductase family protein SCDLUD_003066 [Saccharomycodes ludwigii]|uniref:sepiapterin reductase family protein n=1 Tax=Saccharomycodes ludwigii TaxID=36035 RepID=UPI001E890F61|nr:hypothetical protein SCDLUD_003066 [Saccharomycodes ludwigii]KAH3900099.1 hypothetical protein SCDLUD_003066 [Saccharomycodes ludwigii]
MSNVIIVTGCSKGLGKAIVEKLLSLSSSRHNDVLVIGLARSKEKLICLQEKFGSARFQYICGDITSVETITKLLKFLQENKIHHIQGLICNAGVLQPVGNVNTINVAEWKNLFDVNFFSIVDLVSKLLPFLKQAPGPINTAGNIIFVSSGASVKNYDGWGAYGSSKAALNHFCGTLAREEPLIRAVSVAPGVVDTDMQVEIRKNENKGMSQEALQRFIDLKKKGQLLSPEVPGVIYANLALKGIENEINGKYIRYNDPLLQEYSVNV